ncbi:SMI1/KNR4 family protein [Streptomyces typhae]|uniref:SMI1/KNR4 family protein n=1 Tax=Streptomyces typhae TaxID=2681492 RepID=UPI0018DFE876|nr:SMI1/KNR4 family protein [Streptomyces typhae]
MTETAGTRYDWQGFLTRWSGEWADAYDPEESRDARGDAEACEARWLGFAPAAPERVAALEERLGKRLPPSYRTFLAITDGWRHAGHFVYRLAGTEQADWYEDDAGLAEIFGEYLDEDSTPTARRSTRSRSSARGASAPGRYRWRCCRNSSSPRSVRAAGTRNGTARQRP